MLHGCDQVVATARQSGTRLGFEPEPGMLVQTLDDWFRLRDALGAPDCFGLTLDIGHCRCVEPAPVPDCVRKAGPYLVNVQIDDMRRGVHEHLEFGTGEIDFPATLRALADTGYRGLVAVELPRHAHAAPLVARESLAFLTGALAAATDTDDTSEAMTRADRRAGRGRAAPGRRPRVAGGRPVPGRGRPAAVAGLFPAVGRHCGRGPLPDPDPDWPGGPLTTRPASCC